MRFNSGVLYFVHCVDTEGPLTEDLVATFDRLRLNKSIVIEPSEINLRKLQNMEINLDGREKEIANYLDKKRISYLNSWDSVKKMLTEVTEDRTRYKFADSQGNPYLFSWFIIDNVGFKNNPRKKSMGFHAVWDNFHEVFNNRFNDEKGFHFHTVPKNKNAIEYNTSWTNNDWHEQAVVKRLIERKHFPAIFRAGGHIERNDLSYWLEQFIPFDYSCRSYDPSLGFDYQAGDINDWRGAPYDWSAYSPDFYDYRKKGSMKRIIFRALDIDSNAIQIDEQEVYKAFKRATKFPTVLAVSSHDRRNMYPEIEYMMDLIYFVSKKFPEVTWLHRNGLKAAQTLNAIDDNDNPELELNINNGLLEVSSKRPIFGPQPFLAIQEDEDLFYRDNFTRENNFFWVYRIPKGRNISQISVAASGVNGTVDFKETRL